MSSRHGVRLFTGPTLTRYFKRLPVDAYEECRLLCEGKVGNDGEKLITELRKMFRLDPVQLGTVIDLTVDAHQVARTIRDGKEVIGYLAPARIPFHGSKQFLRTSIAPDFKARFPGRITRKVVHLTTVLTSLDLTDFRNQAMAEVERVVRTF